MSINTVSCLQFYKIGGEFSSNDKEKSPPKFYECRQWQHNTPLARIDTRLVYIQRFEIMYLSPIVLIVCILFFQFVTAQVLSTRTFNHVTYSYWFHFLFCLFVKQWGCVGVSVQSVRQETHWSRIDTEIEISISCVYYCLLVHNGCCRF